MSPEQLEKEVLAMPAADRARLADHLLASLETAQVEIDQEWGTEAEDRIKGYESGELSAVSEKDVNRRILENFSLK